MADRLVVLSGSDTLGDRLTSLINALSNPLPLWEAIGDAMAQNTRLRISDQVDVDGSSFVQSYRAKEEGGQTLRDTGRLLNSIIYAADPRGVSWGVSSELPYAWVLNDGATITAKTKPYLRFKVGGRWVQKASVTIPRRQFLGFNSSDKQEVLDLVSDFLNGGH